MSNEQNLNQVPTSAELTRRYGDPDPASRTHKALDWTPNQKAKSLSMDSVNPQFWNRRFASVETLQLRNEVMKSLSSCWDNIIPGWKHKSEILNESIVKDANLIVDKYEDEGVHWTSLMLCADLAKKNTSFQKIADGTMDITIVP